MPFAPRETSRGWLVEFVVLSPHTDNNDKTLYHTASLRWRSKTVPLDETDLCLTFEMAQAIADRRNGVSRKK